MIITQQYKRWGNGAGVLIPKKVAEAAKIELDQPLEVSIKDGSIVLKPIHNHKPTLNQLLSGVTPDMVGGEFDLGSDVGRERVD